MIYCLKKYGGTFCLLLMVFFLPGGSRAEDAKKIYTLKASITQALVDNRGLKAQKEKVREAEYIEKQAKADLYPKLSTPYGFTYLSEVRTADAVPIGGGIEIPGYALNTRDNFQWKTSITQPLFTGFALTSAHELAKLGIDQSKLNLETTKLDLVLRVKEAYFDILGAEKAVEVAEKAVESLRSNVHVTRSFYKVGMIPINDLLKVEVELANAVQGLVKARNAVKLTKSAFNTLLSRPVNNPVEVEDILVYSPEEGSFETYQERALNSRPEIRLIDVNLQQADQQIRLAGSKFYPEASLSYDYIKEGDDVRVSGSDFHDAGHWQVAAGLTWTFWEWGKTRSAVREKESVKRQIQETRKILEDAIALEIRKAVLDLDVAAKNVPTTEKAVEQGEENLRVSEERYKAQVTTITEVLDAQSLLTQARVNYYSALYNHNLAKARLRRALGEY